MDLTNLPASVDLAKLSRHGVTSRTYKAISILIILHKYGSLAHKWDISRHAKLNNKDFYLVFNALKDLGIITSKKGRYGGYFINPEVASKYTYRDIADIFGRDYSIFGEILYEKYFDKKISEGSPIWWTAMKWLNC